MKQTHNVCAFVFVAIISPILLSTCGGSTSGTSDFNWHWCQVPESKVVYDNRCSKRGEESCPRGGKVVERDEIPDPNVCCATPSGNEVIVVATACPDPWRPTTDLVCGDELEFTDCPGKQDPFANGGQLFDLI